VSTLFPLALGLAALFALAGIAVTCATEHQAVAWTAAYVAVGSYSFAAALVVGMVSS
jgi:hypothetical protein